MKRTKRTRLLAALLALLMTGVMLPEGVLTAFAAQTDPLVTVEAETETTDFSFGDNDALFEQYADRVFSGAETAGGGKRKSPKNTGDSLTGQDRVIYNALRAAATEIAAGNRDTAVVEVPFSDLGLQTEYTAEDLGLDYIYDFDTEQWNPNLDDKVNALLTYHMSQIQNRLIADCPYEFYWMSGGISYTTGLGYSAGFYGNEIYVQLSGSGLSFKMKVEPKYRQSGGDQYSVDTTKTGAASAAATNAMSIVSQAANKNDFEKLTYYKEQICGRVTYNTEAANGGSSYEDKGAWALIYVFDNDPNTNVVCEGYSEAFQYLCDQTEFDHKSVCAYCVTGTMAGGTGAGPHKWNVVHMNDNKNYMADITNSDEGSIGSGGELFLKGISGSVSGGYQVTIHGTDVLYTYDEDTLETFSTEELTLSTGDYIVETQHSYGNWSVVTEPTCNAPGLRQRVCATCGDIDTEEIPAAHTWKTEYTVDRPATCAEEGSESIHCAVCDAIQEGSAQAIPKTDHAYGEWEVTKEATCTEAGSRKKVCANCNDTVVEEIPARGHTWKDSYTVDTPATCAEEGSESIHCSVCNTVKEGSARAVPKTDHAYGEWEVTEEATCTEAGSRKKVCANCNDTVVEEIPAKGHTWKDSYTVDTPATCVEEGSESIHCSVCGAVQEGSAQVIPKADHDYGDWQVTEEATCTEAGSKKKICVNCNDIVVEEIPAKGHSWNDNYTIDQLATCTEEGTKSIHCSVCGAVQENSAQAIPKTDHAYGDWVVTKEATCTEAGSMKKVCANCDDTVIEAIAPKGHTWEEDYTVDIPATSTEEGSESIHCSVCDAVQDGSARTIPKINHQPTSGTCGENLTWELNDEGTLTISGSGNMPNYDDMEETYPPWYHLRNSIKGVIIQSGVTSIGNNAFVSCNSLTSVSIPNSVERIGVSAFTDCHFLISVSIPSSVTSMGNMAFAGCDSLTGVTFQRGVPSIGNWVFAECYNLTDVDIPDSVTSIGHYAFTCCYGLTNVEIPDSVTNIGEGTFSFCKNLETVRFQGNPPAVLAANAFAEVTATAYYPLSNPNWTDNVRNNYDGTLTWRPEGSLSDCTVTLSANSFTYDGTAKKPAISVKCGDTTLTKGVDYTVTYQNNTNAGTADVTVTGKGTVTGTVKKNFTINRKLITAAMATLSATSYTYNGSAKKPGVTVKDGTKTLTANTDYTVTYATGRTNAGTYKVTVTGKGNYSGTVNKTFTIKAKAITPTVTLSKTAFVYSGKVRKPTITVKDGTATLTTANYTVTWPTGCKVVGIYKPAIKLKGNYSGSKTVSYKINPKGTTLSKVTAVSKGFTAAWTKQATQTTGYQIQYSLSSTFASGNKTALINKNTTLSKKVTGLTAKKKYYVRVRTCKTVGTTKYYSAWSRAMAVTTKA